MSNSLSTCPKSFTFLSCQNNALFLPEIILLVLNINFSIQHRQYLTHWKLSVISFEQIHRFKKILIV